MDKEGNMHWIQLRGLDTSGNAITVWQRATEYMQQPTGFPEIL
jgi:hypothetical protein